MKLKYSAMLTCGSSSLAGIALGAIVSIVLALFQVEHIFMWFLLTCLVVYLLFFTFMIVTGKRDNRLYTRWETRLESKILFQMEGIFKSGRHRHSGKLYLLPDGILLFSVSERPFFREMIEMSAIESCQMLNFAQLEIRTVEKQVYTVLSFESAGLFEALNSQRDWNGRGPGL